jgi:mRNA interferase MazF
VVRRGEVWWAKLHEAGGKRPVLLLSRDISYIAREQVTVAEITTNIRGIPVEVELDKEDGMLKHCCVNLDNIVTIPKDRLTGIVTTLSPAKMAQVREIIIYALGLTS